MIKALIQSTLDTALTGKGIKVYEQRKTGEDAEQYIVYSKGSTTSDDYADDTTLIQNDSVTIQYYYRDTYLETRAGRSKIHENEELIKSALITAGFQLPNGYFDAGDVDDIGFMVTIYECDYQQVV